MYFTTTYLFWGTVHPVNIYLLPTFPVLFFPNTPVLFWTALFHYILRQAYSCCGPFFSVAFCCFCSLLYPTDIFGLSPIPILPVLLCGDLPVLSRYLVAFSAYLPYLCIVYHIFRCVLLRAMIGRNAVFLLFYSAPPLSPLFWFCFYSHSPGPFPNLFTTTPNIQPHGSFYHTYRRGYSVLCTRLGFCLFWHIQFPFDSR